MAEAVEQVGSNRAGVGVYTGEGASSRAQGREHEEERREEVLAVVPVEYPTAKLTRTQASVVFGMLLERSTDAEVMLSISRRGWMNGSLLLTTEDEATSNWIRREIRQGTVTNAEEGLKIVRKRDVEKRCRVVMVVSEPHLKVESVFKELDKRYERCGTRDWEVTHRGVPQEDSREFAIKMSANSWAYIRGKGRQLKLFGGSVRVSFTPRMD